MPAPAHIMMMAGGGSEPQLPAKILSKGPVGYWKLNDTSGTTAVDSSGNGRNGTYSGSGYALASQSGPDGGNYAKFGEGGNSSQVSISNNINFSMAAVVFALIRPDAITTTRTFIVSKGDATSTSGGAYEWAMFHGNVTSGRINCVVWEHGGANLQSEHVDNPVTASAWQAVAFRAVDTAASSRMKLWRNGTDLTEVQDTITGATYTNNPAPVSIGWRGDSPASQFFDGALAHVAILPSSISDADLLEIFSAAQADGWY